LGPDSEEALKTLAFKIVSLNKKIYDCNCQCVYTVLGPFFQSSSSFLSNIIRTKSAVNTKCKSYYVFSNIIYKGQVHIILCVENMKEATRKKWEGREGVKNDVFSLD
jgi:DNA polymerase II small subunit/DNA polymerase delta subunit B